MRWIKFSPGIPPVEWVTANANPIKLREPTLIVGVQIIS
jgi:hypothetical protein